MQHIFLVNCSNPLKKKTPQLYTCLGSSTVFVVDYNNNHSWIFIIIICFLATLSQYLKYLIKILHIRFSLMQFDLMFLKLLLVII